MSVMETNAGENKWKCISTISDQHDRTIYTISWSKNNIIATGAGDDAIRIFKQVLFSFLSFFFFCFLKNSFLKTK